MPLYPDRSRRVGFLVKGKIMISFQNSRLEKVFIKNKFKAHDFLKFLSKKEKASPKASVDIWLISQSKTRSYQESFGFPKDQRQIQSLKLYFSLTATENTMIIATSQAPIGIALQPLDQIISTDLLISILSPEEFEYLAKKCLILQKKDILKIWTLKEAFLDYLGYNSAVIPSVVEVTFSPLKLKKREDLYSKTWSLSLAEHLYIFSLVTPKKALTRPYFRFHWLSFEQIKPI